MESVNPRLGSSPAVCNIGSTLTKGPGDRPQHSAVDALPLGLRRHLAIRERQYLGEQGKLSLDP